MPISSEGVEEEVLGRISDLEADLELPPELQEALSEETRSFLATLEAVQDRLAEMGRAVDLANARQMSRFLGLPLTGSNGVLVMSLIALLALGLGVTSGFVRELPREDVLLILLPPALGLMLVILMARHR